MSTAISSNAGILMESGSLTPILSSTSSAPNRLKTDSLSGTASRQTANAANEDGNAKESIKAREVATRFEALLVHNLLKSMRKTTLSENTSNERALYDDMLDENLADTIVNSGGLGIADRIYEQIIQGKKQTANDSAKPLTANEDRQSLRDLAMHLPAANKANNTSVNSLPYNSDNSTTTDTTRLQLVSNLWAAQPDQNNRGSLHKQNFIATLLPEARTGAQRLGTTPAAILAIAALETGWGKSMIKDGHGKNSHNLFGIKASPADMRFALTRTTEYINGSPQKIDDKFKVFTDNADAVKGFTDFLTENPRYKNALKHAGEPERFLRELQKAGYATDPEYADKAISIMRQIEQQPIPL